MILNSPYISGSLTVTGNTNLMGALTVTGSLAGTATSSSFAYTASSAVSAYTASSAVNATTALTASYANTFTVGGTLTAQTLVVQTITSSVSYITGSTRFGSTLSNTHTFTGSLQVTGSGPHYIYGNTILGGTSDLGSEAGTTHAIIQNNTLTNSRGLAFYANDGVQNPRTWILHSTTSGTQQLQFNSNWSSATGYASFAFLNGNVGIGTASPTQKLHVSGSGDVIITAENSSNTAGVYLQLTTPSYNWYLMNNVANTGDFRIRYGTYYYMTIGTTATTTISGSASSLFVLDSSDANGGYARFRRGGTDFGWIGSAYHLTTPVGANTDLAVASSGNLVFNTDASLITRMFISSSGNIGIGTSTLNAYATRFLQIHNTSGNSALRLTNSTTGTTRDDGFDIEMRTSDVYLVARDAGFNMIFGTQDTARMFISASGNVGIGTTAPTSLLTLANNSALSWINGNSYTWGLYKSVNDLLINYTSGTDITTGTNVMYFKGSNGYVGIGTTTPTYQLQVSSATGGLISLNSTTTNAFRGIVFQNNAASDSTEYAYIKYNATSGEFRFYANPAAFGGYTTWYSNNAESMRLSSAGNLYLGGTSQIGSAKLSTYGSVAAQNGGVDGTYAEAFTAYYSGNNTESNAILTSVSSVAASSGFRFDVSNGGGSAARTTALTLTRAAATFAYSITAPGLSSTGNISIAKTTPGLSLDGTGSGNSGAYVNFLGWANTNKNWQINSAVIAGDNLNFIPSTAAGGSTFSTAVGTLSSAGVWSTTGGGTSDRRLKQNIQYISESVLENINSLKPAKFQFVNNPEKTRRGFIAQDVLETSISDLVLGNGEEENGVYGLDYDGILALAIKAIQELKAELDELKNK